MFSFACAGPSFELPLVRLTNVLGPRLVQTVAKIREAMSSPRQPGAAPARDPPGLSPARVQALP
ncbi:hypothetical protein LP416_10335 [Polaromonas sp. P2-4]|nr:hypothetical protein LP416_10335 [Polaromonas sp. P2-4]